MILSTVPQLRQIDTIRPNKTKPEIVAVEDIDHMTHDIQ